MAGPFVANPTLTQFQSAPRSEERGDGAQVLTLNNNNL